jgi:hypothetical protein
MARLEHARRELGRVCGWSPEGLMRSLERGLVTPPPAESAWPSAHEIYAARKAEVLNRR